jgi:hypothetical protein
MQLEIYAERLIIDVQKDFTSTYPFLKIEFFRNGGARQDRYPTKHKFDDKTKLKHAWLWKKDKGHLDVNDAMSVLELENAFIDQFGLSAQVYRRSGNIWLETTMTDNWTLKQQNDHGREITIGSKTTIEEDSANYELHRDANN